MFLRQQRLWFTLAIGALGLTSMGLTLTPGPARSQVGVTPLSIQAYAERGVARSTITVRNTTDQPNRVRVYTEPFTYDRDHGFMTLQESEEDLSPYLRFSPRELTIPPATSRRIRLLAVLPPSLPDGEYRTAVFTETLTEAVDSDDNTVRVQARIAVTVYVIKGQVQPDLSVEKVQYGINDDDTPDDDTPLAPYLEVLVRNQGQATALPQVVWWLTRGDQDKVLLEGESPKGSVIADSTRRFTLPLTSETTTNFTSLAPGEYQFQGQLVWWPGLEPSVGDEPETLPFSLPLTVRPREGSHQQTGNNLPGRVPEKK